LLIGGAAVVATVGWTALGTVLYESVPPESVLAQLVITAVPLHLGREVHRRRARMQELQLRAEQAERDREDQARRAVAEERTRIARELHDVVAHQMTVMTIQADGAARIARDGDPRVAGALATIKETGQQALAEMRRVVGLLRTQDDEVADLAPLPQLADLDELVQRVHAAGVDVDMEVHGEARPVAEGVQLSAYRVIQESLTNAVRHGGPNTSARVRVCYRDAGLDLLVEDDGRGAAADDGPGGGHGLVGMRERVAVLGGSFEAGPRQGGGFRVHATIPYAS
jgi:signal transduction histidine kinase